MRGWYRLECIQSDTGIYQVYTVRYTSVLVYCGIIPLITRYTGIYQVYAPRVNKQTYCMVGVPAGTAGATASEVQIQNSNFCDI